MHSSDFCASNVFASENVCQGFLPQEISNGFNFSGNSVTVWQCGESKLSCILSYLYESKQVLFLKSSEHSSILILSSVDDSSGIMTVLDSLESSLLSSVLQTGTSENGLDLPNDLLKTISSEEKLIFSPSKPRPRTTDTCGGLSFDNSVLEEWRVPDLPVKSVACRLTKEVKRWQDSKSSYNQNMLRLRESYLPGASQQQTETKEDNMRDSDPGEGVAKEKTSLEKRLSGVSTQSTISRVSSKGDVTQGKASSKELKTSVSLSSRGALLRQLGGDKARSCAALEGESVPAAPAAPDSAAIAQEALLRLKAKASSEVVASVGTVSSTSGLVQELTRVKDSMVGNVSLEDLSLAGYAEACVSLLLQHLETMGVTKTSLEQLVGERLLLNCAQVATMYPQQAQLGERLGEHKVQVLLRAEVHWLLASQERQEEFESVMLGHLRQVALHGGTNTLTDFLQLTLTSCYLSRQPDLLQTLYEELELERPHQLASIFSPAPPSARPKSLLSSVKKNAVKSTKKRDSSEIPKSFSRQKSFQASLMGRQINLAAGKKGRRDAKVVTTGRYAGRVSKAVRQGMSAKKRKTLLAQLPAKSPKKPLNKNKVKRNLLFDEPKSKSPRKKASPVAVVGKSPRKNCSVVTPSKARRRTPYKMTPGKVHKILAPETPHIKAGKFKSDGQTSIAETPDKNYNHITPRKHEASLQLHKRASFYSGNNSRSVQRFEDQFNASWLRGSINDGESQRLSTGDEIEAQENSKYNLLFSNFLGKRKNDDFSLPTAGVKRRLTSFSDTTDVSFLPATTSTMLPGAKMPPLASTCVDLTNDRLHPSGFDISSISNLSRTPKKSINLYDDDIFSPNKRVQFNMAPQPPTPSRGVAAKSILKTPSKTPGKTPMKSPFLTPSRRDHQSITPLKTPTNSRVASRKLTLLSTPQKDSEFSDSGSTLQPSQSLSSLTLVGKSPLRRDLVMSPGRILVPMGSKCLESTLPLNPRINNVIPSMKTPQDIPTLSTPAELQTFSSLPCDPPANSSETLLSQGELGSGIFDSSALYPRHLVSSLQDSSVSSSSISKPILSSCEPLTPSRAPLTPMKLNLGLISDELHIQSPVKVANLIGNQELELVSPVKKVKSLREVIDSDNDEENYDLVDNCERDSSPKVTSLEKKESELSVAASSDRCPTPELGGPSSGYSSEPQPELSPVNYFPSSPCIQVSSPLQEEIQDNVKEDKIAKPLRNLTDRLSDMYRPASRKRSSPFRSLTSPLYNDSIINETPDIDTPEHIIQIGGVKEPPSTPGTAPLSRSSSGLSVEREIHPRIPLPDNLGLTLVKSESGKNSMLKELASLEDKMTPYFSAKLVKRKSVLRESIATEEFASIENSVSKSKPKRAKLKEGSGGESKDMNVRTTGRSKSGRVRHSTNFYTEDLGNTTDEDFEVDDAALQSVEVKVKNVNSKLNIVGKFKCKYCRKKFPTRKKLHEHENEELRIQNEKRMEKTIKQSSDLITRVGKDVGDVENEDQPNMEPKAFVEANEGRIDVNSESCTSPIVKQSGKYKCKYCRQKFSSRKELNIHEKKELDQRLTVSNDDAEEMDIINERLGLPKVVSELQDSLSKNFTPKTLGRQRKLPDRLSDELVDLNAPSTPKILKTKGSKKLFRAPTILTKIAKTSTPNNVDLDSMDLASRRRSIRSSKNISYAEIPDFETSVESDSSPELTKNKSVLQSIASRASLGNNSLNSSIVHVKDHNTSQHDIHDISVCEDCPEVDEELMQVNDVPDGKYNARSPGKYFSVAKLVETPSGQIRMRLNRITKPHQEPKTPLSKIASEKSGSPKEILSVTRISRRAAQDIGISPRKLHGIMTGLSPRKIEGNKGIRTPEKENFELKTGGNKTPKIRIKKTGSETPGGIGMWKAETVLSPQKQGSPLKAIHLSNKSPRKKTFSPLSSRSIHKLSTSPIISTEADSKPLKKRVHKQLAYL